MVDRGSLDYNKNLAHVDRKVRDQAPLDRTTILAHDFVPTSYDVICGRGKKFWNHVGNQRFRVTVDIYFPRFKAARNKMEKSLVIMEIIDLFRSNSKRGGFVRQKPDSRIWYEVGDSFAREKVGQALREKLLEENPQKHSERKARKASLKKAHRENAKQRFKDRAESNLYMPPCDHVLNCISIRESFKQDSIGVAERATKTRSINSAEVSYKSIGQPLTKLTSAFSDHTMYELRLEDQVESPAQRLRAKAWENHCGRS